MADNMEQPGAGMEKYSSYHIKTNGFQQIVVGVSRLLQTILLDRKCRVVIDYDPALPKISIDTFTDKSDKAQVQGKHPLMNTEMGKQAASGKKAACDDKIVEMGIEEFNRLLLGYSKSLPRSKL